jgi:hypothetical protein
MNDEPLPLERRSVSGVVIETTPGRKHPGDRIIVVDRRAISFEDFLDGREEWPVEAVAEIRRMLYHNENVLYPPPRYAGSRLLARAEAIYDERGRTAAYAYIAQTKRSMRGVSSYEQVVDEFTRRPLHSHCSCTPCARLAHLDRQRLQ